MYDPPERYNIFSIRGETLSFVIHWRRENSGRVPRILGKASFLGRALIGRRAPRHPQVHAWTAEVEPMA